ncbi:MAG TPA: WS/DGAT domain-containing protein, partial [Mobilitalea sp.]|nr:WS/DGAT domain-containing protein [Mobilitalea sp.]
MIDMRRYLKDKSFTALSNLSSTVIISITVNPGERFDQTLAKVSKEMNSKKNDNLGMSTFLKLDTLYKVLGYNLSYHILKKSLKNPAICMTNIGVLDSDLLKFEGSGIENAYVFGSIKYRPHFQLAMSSYKDTMTLCVNLYGSREDKQNFKTFLDLMEKELGNASNSL